MNTHRRRHNGWEGVLALGCLLVAACIGQIGMSPSPDSCDGIDAEVGGCDPDRPVFVGTGCEAIGREAGRQLNDRLLGIFHGPDVVDGGTRAVRATHMTSLIASLANLHLRQKGLVAECGVDEFLAAAQEEFSEAFRSEAGTYLYDGPPVAFSEWLADTRRFFLIIDMEEDAVDSPTASSE